MGSAGRVYAGGWWCMGRPRGDLSPSTSFLLILVFRAGLIFFGGLPDLFVFVCVGKTGGGPPCRLGSEAWLAGSPIRTRCPCLAMFIQQCWEVVAGLDTALEALQD
jgi:hypothetical protein